MNTQTQDFEGYKRNQLGHLVPVEIISEWELLEDATALDLSVSAEKIQAEMMKFKASAMADIQALTDLILEKYGVKRGGQIGYRTIRSYDASVEIRISQGKQLSFGPELDAARVLVDTCICKWAEGSNPHIRALVQHAFRTDEEGRISASRIWELTQIQIEDPDWKTAMQALRDSVRWIGEKPYIRFYRRHPETKKLEMLTMDMAAL